MCPHGYASGRGSGFALGLRIHQRPSFENIAGRRRCLRRAGSRNPVFLLDECHLMKDDMLDHLHILQNYAWDSKALLSLVLIGLPELGELVEFGCGTGIYTETIVPKTTSMFATDLSDSLLAVARTRIGDHPKVTEVR